MSDERVKLSRAEADALLKPGAMVHTFMQTGGPGLILIGADWDREDILDLADKGRVELAGEAATKMKHGIAAFSEGRPVVFCETIESAT